MGYKISGVSIEKIQQVQYEMLVELDRICRKHQIVYQLFSGTLLGAVRHQGFIPWDDDLDVCMLREDYNRFIEICETELSDAYFFQRPETDPYYLLQFGKLRKNNSSFVENTFSKEPSHHGVYIDIFPFDSVEIESAKGKFQILSFFILNRMNLVRSKAIADLNPNPLKRFIRNSVRVTMYLFPRKLMNFLLMKLTRLFEGEEVSDLCSGEGKENVLGYLTTKKAFYDVIEIPFESGNFYAPREYDAVLKQIFGEYMTPPPLEEQVPHHNIIDIKL